jgi:hypothetical protein
MASRPAKRKVAKLPLKTRIENYILGLTPQDIKKAKSAFPDAKKVVGELQAEIKAERAVEWRKQKAEYHPNTGICDFCEKVVPWSELEGVKMGLRIGMFLCKECRTC